MREYGLGNETYLCQVDLPSLFGLVDRRKEYKPLPKFPAVTRDLALLCDEKLPVLALEKAIRQAAGDPLEHLELFDVYQGEQVEKGKKSVAFSLALRSHDHTLTDKESDEVMQRVLHALEKECGALIRR